MRLYFTLNHNQQFRLSLIDEQHLNPNIKCCYKMELTVHIRVVKHIKNIFLMYQNCMKKKKHFLYL